MIRHIHDAVLTCAYLACIWALFAAVYSGVGYGKRVVVALETLAVEMRQPYHVEVNHIPQAVLDGLAEAQTPVKHRGGK